MKELLVFIIAYLLGSISFSYEIAKRIKKIDIRNHGSGNAGATNTLRVLGIGPAILVLALDIAKGIVAVLIAKYLGVSPWAVAFTGLLAILGHNWPIYYGFRGGKGVATTIGVFAILNFLPTLIAGVITIIIIAITRYVSLGSLVLMILTPILTIFIGHYPMSYTYVDFVIMILAIIRHRANIQRLLTGKENKIGQKTKEK